MEHQEPGLGDWPHIFSPDDCDLDMPICFMTDEWCTSFMGLVESNFRKPTMDSPWPIVAESGVLKGLGLSLRGFATCSVYIICVKCEFRFSDCLLAPSTAPSLEPTSNTLNVWTRAKSRFVPSVRLGKFCPLWFWKKFQLLATEKFSHVPWASGNVKCTHVLKIYPYSPGGNELNFYSEG